VPLLRLRYRRASRAAWRLAFDPADVQPIEKLKRRVLFAAKVNNAPDALRLTYRIEGVELPNGISTSRVVFAAQSDAAPPKKWSIDEAEAWLRRKFAAGPVNSSDLVDIPAGTRDRALKRIGVEKEQIPGSRQFIWRLQEG
jgi:hypothetical protein